MATAKKLPSGNWRVQASVTVDNKIIRKSFTNKDKRTAEAEAKMWQAGMVDVQASNDITLSECYDRYIQAKDKVLSPSTIKGYKKLKKNHLQDIMCLKIESLTNEAVQRSINIYAATHSPKSVRNCYGLLSSVLKMFRPTFNLNIKLPQKEDIIINVPEDKDIQAILNAAKGTRCYIPILLAAFGSMREGEVCAITSEDFTGNFVRINKSMVLNSDNEWVIKTPKTYASNRVTELPDFVINAIQDIDGRIVDYNPRALSTAFSRLLKSHNLPHFRFHDLRHYYVSSLHSINIPDKYIQAQGGWSTNYTMNKVYKHILSAQQSKFSKKITKHFDKLANG